MLTERVSQGIALVFIGCGAVGAADIAMHVQQPLFALGYLAGAVIFLATGVARLLKSF